MKTNNNPNTLVERLWPYIQFEDHKEYLTQDKHLEFEGLYLNLWEREWLPQNSQYINKAIDYTKDFREALKLIELM